MSLTHPIEPCTIAQVNDTRAKQPVTPPNRKVSTMVAFLLPFLGSGLLIAIGVSLARTTRVQLETVNLPYTSNQIKRDLVCTIYESKDNTVPAGRVLLLHGTNSTRESFRFLGCSLAHLGMEAIALDFTDDVWSCPEGHLGQALVVMKHLIPTGSTSPGNITPVPWATVGHSDGGEPAFILGSTFQGARAVTLIGTMVPDVTVMEEEFGAQLSLPNIMGLVGMYDEIFFPDEVAMSLEVFELADSLGGSRDKDDPILSVSPLSDHFIETLDPIILGQAAAFLARSVPKTGVTDQAVTAPLLIKRISVDIIGETILYLGIMWLVSLFLFKTGATLRARRLLLVAVIATSCISGPIVGPVWPALLLFSMLPFFLITSSRKRDNRPALNSVLVVLWAAAILNLIVASKAFWNDFPDSILFLPVFPIWTLVSLLPKLVSVLKLYGASPWETGLSALPWTLVFFIIVEIVHPGKIAFLLDQARIFTLKKLRGPFSIPVPPSNPDDISSTVPIKRVSTAQLGLLFGLITLAAGLWYYRYTQGVLGMDLLISQTRMATRITLGPLAAVSYLRMSAYRRDKRAAIKG